MATHTLVPVDRLPAVCIRVAYMLCVVGAISCATVRHALAKERAASRTANAKAVPMSDADVGRLGAQYYRALYERDLRELKNTVIQCHQECLASFGVGHPDEQAWRRELIVVQKLRTLSDAQLEEYWQAKEDLISAANNIMKLVCATTPNPHDTADSFAQVRATRHIFARLGIDEIAIRTCDLWLVHEPTIIRDWGRSQHRANRFAVDWRAEAGQESASFQSVGLLNAHALMEGARNVALQIELAKRYIAFADRYGTRRRYVFWRERGMVTLAEIRFRAGSHQEADRLFAEVSRRVPEKCDHELAGWCKSWCDRHEARQLMEMGDWEGAYNKILQARVGTIDYGHRNLNKGLTMERILRMSAEIQTHRGNHKEAQEDLEYAELIANHTKKLRAALEAEMEKPAAEDAATPMPPAPR